MDKEKISRKIKDETPAPWEGQSGPIYQKGNSEQMEKLVEENLRLTREIYKMTKKINSFVVWSRIFGFLKVLLIIAPIILGIMYLKPILNLFGNAFAPYKELLNMGSEGGSGINPDGINVNQLSPELKKLMGK